MGLESCLGICPHRWHLGLRTCQGQHAEPLLGQGSVPTRYTPACLAWGTWATASMGTGPFCLSLVADTEMCLRGYFGGRLALSPSPRDSLWVGIWGS